MTARQTTEGMPAPIAANLDTPPWARAPTPQGRSQAESSRTANRGGVPHADDTTTGVRRHCTSFCKETPDGSGTTTPHTLSPGTAQPGQPAVCSIAAVLVTAHHSGDADRRIFGVVMGGLMFLSEKSVLKAVATGLTTAAVSTPVLHKLIG